MLEIFLTTVLSSALFMTSAAFMQQAPVHDVVFTQVLPQKNYVSYTVEAPESLASISMKYYGSEDYWTNLWNDNPAITDPENIKEHTMIKVRAYVPLKVAELDTVLADHEAVLAEEENQAYLKQIGYLSAKKVQPTVVPTQASSVNASNVTSTISDEAITHLGNCEAGMDPAKNTGNGYYGAFQFSHGTWKSLNTGYERADLAPLEVQKVAVKQLLQRSSVFSQFPGCANKMRTAGLI